jgi:FG-GAP-like repeat
MGRWGTRGRAGRIPALRAALVAVVTAAFVVAPVAPARAATMFGHDISWPQCSPAAGGFGLPMPPTTTQFVIVGLTRGLALTENPCLAGQVQWLRDNGKRNHAYAMATYPTEAQLSAHGSSGPWASSTRAGRLSNTGYAAAEFAVASMTRVRWRPPMVWIDVEPRPAQPWPTSAAARNRESRYVIEGLMRGLRDNGFSYGLYSYANGWNEIVGGWYLPTVPVWATAGELDHPTEALERCSQPSFSGGRVYLAQWYDSTRDYDRTCDWYSFQPPRIPPAIATGSLHDWDADWTNDVLRLNTSGWLWHYRGDGDGGFTGRAAMTTSFSAMRAVVGPGDLTGDRRHDLLAVDTSGRLYLYPGDGAGGLGTRRLVGSGWSSMRLLAGPGDMTSDGRGDLLALDTAGRLWLYPGTDAGTFRPRIQVASGWSGMVDVVGIGDLTLDRRADVVALDGAGRLWLYPGTGTGTLGARTQLASGWTGARLIAPGDVDGDRLVDLLTHNAAGTLALYPGTASGGLGARQGVATGWTGVRDAA